MATINGITIAIDMDPVFGFIFEPEPTITVEVITDTPTEFTTREMTLDGREFIVQFLFQPVSITEIILTDGNVFNLDGSLAGSVTNINFTITPETPLDLPISAVFTGDDFIDGSELPDVAFGFSGNDVVLGRAGNDVIFGNEGNDVLFGGLGEDFVQGNTGNDFVQGNQGDDIVRGGQGDDTVRGGQGNDVLFGDKGNDNVFGDIGADFVFGGPDVDFVQGNTGNDFVQGNQGDDTVRGGQDDDTVRGGQGNDVLFGDKGNDDVLGDKGNDVLFGGPDFDTFIFGDSSGQDVIADFELDVDLIAIASNVNGSGIFSEADALAQITTDVFGDAVFDLGGGNTVTLVGVDPSTISEADILIF